MKKFLQFFASLVLLCFATATTYGQSATISGVVTSADDQQPLFGVSVVVKGTTKGTITDVDGKYSLTAPENQHWFSPLLVFPLSSRPLVVKIPLMWCLKRERMFSTRSLSRALVLKSSEN